MNPYGRTAELEPAALFSRQFQNTKRLKQAIFMIVLRRCLLYNDGDVNFTKSMAIEAFNTGKLTFQMC